MAVLENGADLAVRPCAVEGHPPGEAERLGLPLELRAHHAVAHDVEVERDAVPGQTRERRESWSSEPGMAGSRNWSRRARPAP